MIYKATHHFFLYPFFKLYTLWKIRRNFHNVYINGEFHEKKLPVLLLSNHLSWWDGFWAMYLNIKLFQRKFYFMMIEEQLKKYKFFNKTGGYSVKKGSRSIIETLEYTIQLLKDKNNMVLLFPQGEIQSLYTQTIHFENGIGNIMKKVSGPVQVIFLVNLVEYFSNPKPGLYLYLKEYTGKDFTTENLEKEYNYFYVNCISEDLRIKEAK
jgi:1-acyl-sn-glycerol-3-phosphate acyltransferase